MLYADPTGHWFGLDDLVATVVGAIVGGVSAAIQGGDIWQGMGVGAAAGWVGYNTFGAAAGEISHWGLAGGVGPPTAGMATAGQFGGSIVGGAAGGATAGGMNAGINGGNVGESMMLGAGYGAATGAALGALKLGWEYTQESTDSSSPTQRYDNTGNKMTAGTRPCDGCTANNQNWFTKAGMVEEGLDHNYIFGIKYNTDSAFGHFINEVSKPHDFMNSWGYNSSGHYAAGSAFYNTAFQAYSLSGMIPAGAFTTLAVYGPYMQPAVYSSALGQKGWGR